MKEDQSDSLRGRGAVSNPDNRYDTFSRESFDDGWGAADEEPLRLKTILMVDNSRTVISYNESPDVPFDRSINPYRGCEHGCIYCYARPGHAFLGYSPGLDFESRLFYKPDVEDCVRRELAAGGYRCAPIAIGGVTDAYQPLEQRLRLTRRILELLHACEHPFTLVTKSALVERDGDILEAMAARAQAQVMISLTTLDKDLARRMEPRAAAPLRRLEAIRRLSRRGIPVGVLVAPVIPGLTDNELERLMKAAREAGAVSAGYILLRLPLDVADLFREWLEVQEPDRARRVLSLIRDTRKGKLNQTGFGSRMTGSGPYAELIAQRFELAWKRLTFRDSGELNCGDFIKPSTDPRQMRLL